MKLYHWKAAVNPRRVRVFLAEKGTTVPMEDVGGETQLHPQFIEKYRHALVPMLELDTGTCIWEAMAICRYFEDLYPDPPLMGVDAADRAIVDMWERRAYEEGLLGAEEVFRNSHPAFKDRGLAASAEPVPQIPDLIERGRRRLRRFYSQLDQQLATNEFVAGQRYTVADITTLCAIDFAKWTDNNGVPPGCANLRRWYAAVSARPSASA
jgi:glutathione S-transferase